MNVLVGHNMLGQDVNLADPNLASGYYVYSDEAANEMFNSGNSNCPQEMRPGIMNIKGLDEPIPTCGGRVYQENLPDIYIVDWRYRQYVQMLLGVLALAMAVAVVYKLANK